MKILSISLAFLLVSQAAYSEIRGLEVKQRLGEELRSGIQYVFLIAINKYTEWSNLKNPVNDAKEIRDILQSEYYIDIVVELYNEDATKSNILRKFNELQKLLKPEDSLLIFYAGHGYFDHRVTNSGFWIPTNGGTDNFEQANWIPNSQIRGIIGNFKASHICLISDSCFSGDILNTTRGSDLDGQIDAENAAKVYSLTSRQVITSGAEEVVPDNSEFSLQLKMALRKNREPFLDPLTLYAQIRRGVHATLPLLGNLKETGHQEGASFFLFLKPKQEEKKSPPKTAPEPHVLVEEKTGSRRSPMFLSIGAGPQLPVLEGAGNVNLGLGSTISLGFSFPIRSGFLGLAIRSGFTSGEVKESNSSSYMMYSIPLGVVALYELSLGPLFRLIIEAGGGESVNLLSFESGYTPMVYTPFALATLGVEFVINPDWIIGVVVNCAVQFFSNIAYKNLTPSLFLKGPLR